MSTLQPFQYYAHRVRTVLVGGEPWFVATDLCKVIEHSNPSKAVEGLDDDEKGLRDCSTLGGMQSLLCVSEPGMYKLMARSSKPSAKPFLRWLTHEVLPTIRRTGSYGVPVFDWTNPAFQRQMLETQLATLDRAESAEAQLAIAAPKAALADTIIAKKGEIYSVREASNLLAGEGITFGRTGIYQWMRDRGWVGKNDRNPLQRAITAGWLQRKYYDDYEPSTLVTPKGLAKIHEMMLAEREAESRAGFMELAPVGASRAIGAAPRKRKRQSLPAA